MNKGHNLENSRPGRDWASALGLYFKPRVVVMLFLGFSAGLPFLLVFSTLNIWLREAGVSRTEIGFFAWVGISFSLKALWAPLADSLRLPLLGSLGQRRSWIFLGQIGVIVGLVGMALTDPARDLAIMAGFASLVALSSATQDIAIDAYRIEAAQDDWQGAMAANYQLGWRLGALAAGVGALYLAEFSSWLVTYQAMAALMTVGLATTLAIAEPVVKDRPMRKTSVSFIHWLQGAVVQPFVELFKRKGLWSGVILLTLVGIYKIGDVAMGSMASPLYIDMGFQKTDIANIAKGLGFGATILGVYLGGVLTARFGVLRIVLLGAVLTVITTLAFRWLSTRGPDLDALSVVIVSDSLAGGLAGTAFIAFLSNQTNRNYTATQYALFSSFITLPGKAVSGFSGIVVDAWGYEFFFLCCAIMGIPVIFLVLFFLHRQTQTKTDREGGL